MLYLWGKNRQGARLAVGSDEKAVYQPQPLAGMDGVKFVSLAAGGGHTAALTQWGDVVTLGRNKEGQLGLGHRGEVTEPSEVAALREEIVVDVACGSAHTLAVTAAGKVYHWGLLHYSGSSGVGEPSGDSGDSGDSEEEYKSGSGSSSGESSDSSDSEDSDAGAEAAGEAEDEDGGGGGGAGALAGLAADLRQNDFLRRVIRDSTMRYLSAGKRRIEEGQLQMRVSRRVVSLPREVPGLADVVSVAAGYAHSAALTRDGRVFTMGYNDRGQLGLGHRLNTCDFQLVEKLAPFRIAQVACGERHCIARVDLSEAAAEIQQEHARGIPVVPHVLVWGSNGLGQLGIGSRGGRLLPAPLRVRDRHIVDVSAGANFTLAVSAGGEVFAWGHSEYGAVGTAALEGRDLADAQVYYRPQPVEALARFDVASVRCGSQHSLALTRGGDVVSFGWNAFGVLGHGKGHFSMQPEPVPAVPAGQALQVAAGHHHCAALVRPQGALHARRFKHLLDRPEFADCRFVCDDGKALPAHLAVVTARCGYMRGYVRAAGVLEPGELLTVPVPDGVRYDVFRALLVYLYTDRVKCPPHRLGALAELAREFCVERLALLAAGGGGPPSSFAADLGALVGADAHADVRFAVGGRVLPAHRALLGTSEYFKGMFSGRFREAGAAGGPIAIEGVAPDVFERVLRFAYTGEARFEDPNDTMETLAAGALFSMTDLVRSCEHELSKHVVDESSAAVCLQFADAFQMPRLARQSSSVLLG